MEVNQRSIFIACIVLLAILSVYYIASAVLSERFTPINNYRAYDVANMDYYSEVGPHSAAVKTPTHYIQDAAMDKFAYKCYCKPDDFLKQIDRIYQPRGIDGIGVLANNT